MMGPFEPIPSLISVMNQANMDATRQTMGIASVLGQMQESELRRYQLMAAKQDAEQKQAQQEAMQRLIAGIQDPTQRTAATLNPTEYGKSLLREPQKLEYFDPATGRKTYGWAKPGEQPMQIGGIEKKLLTPEEIANAAAAKEAEERATFPYKRSIAKAGNPGPSVLSVNMAKEIPGAVLSKYGTMLEDSYNRAKAAAEGVRDTDRFNEVVNSGQYFSGPGANAKKKIVQIGKVLGWEGKTDDEILANTKEISMQLAKNSATARATLMKDPQVSKADLDFLANLSGGTDIADITQPELIRLGKLLKYSHERQYAAHQQKLSQLRKVDVSSPNAMSELAGMWDVPDIAPNPMGPPAADALPPAPPANDRVSGQTYQTPKGPMKWTGTGWIPGN